MILQGARFSSWYSRHDAGLAVCSLFPQKEAGEKAGLTDLEFYAKNLVDPKASRQTTMAAHSHVLCAGPHNCVAWIFS